MAPAFVVLLCGVFYVHDLIDISSVFIIGATVSVIASTTGGVSILLQEILSSQVVGGGKGSHPAHQLCYLVL